MMDRLIETLSIFFTEAGAAVRAYWLHFVVYSAALEAVLILQTGIAAYTLGFVFALAVSWVAGLVALGLFCAYKQAGEKR